MNTNKQRWLGGVVLLCGGALLASLVLKGKPDATAAMNTSPSFEQIVPENDQSVTDINENSPQFQPLTMSVEQEQQLLQAQNAERERAQNAQDQKYADYLAQQRAAEDRAAREAAAENGTVATNSATTPVATAAATPALSDAATTALNRADKTAEELAATQERLKAEAEAKKRAEQAQKETQEQTEKKQREAELAAEKRKEAEREEAARLAREKEKEKEEKRKEQAQREAQAKQNNPWMVQVGLTTDKAAADQLAEKLSAKGFKVTKSPTSKGTRILVGDEDNKAAAQAILKKIEADSGLGVKGAWVIHWQPATP